MKKKLLSMAVVAAFAGGATTAQAVNVNPDGLGQVLLYPYFTVQNDFTTAIHVVNTTDQTKAVKVRFLEGKNSMEVLDFNLYLSPQDVWTGAVVYDETHGARLISADNSCIAPNQIPAGGEPFRTFLFDDNTILPGSDDVDFDDANRRREGYVEIIEMGVFPEEGSAASGTLWADYRAAIKHDSDGVPVNCALIAQQDTRGLGEIPGDSDFEGLMPPTGGLFGSGHLISVNGGVRTSYDPVALADFYVPSIPGVGNLWNVAGDEAPSLEDVNTFAHFVDIANNRLVEFEPFGDEIDAVSAVLTKAAIFNEYTIDAGRDSKTDWVVTFPTKRFYVNNPGTQRDGSSPFQRAWWNGQGTVAEYAGPLALTACHDIDYVYYDREEQKEVPDPVGGDFSPRLPGVTPTASLCTEVNTVTIWRDDAELEASRLFGAVSTAADLRIQSDFSTKPDAGWIAMTFEVDDGGDYGVLYGEDSFGPIEIEGLPVIGFAASRVVNAVDVQVDGLQVYSAYMGSMVHKGSQEISASARPQ